MKTLTLASLALALSLALSPEAHAGLGGKAAAELAEFVMKKFGKEVAEEGAEKLAGRIASAVARHGDDVLAVVRKVGPKALGLADEARGNAPRVIRFLTRHGDDGMRVLSHPQGMALFTRFGDDAAEVLVRHNGVAAPLLEQFGEPAVKALGAVGQQTGRRMAILAGDMSGSGRAPELMGVISRFGDPAMEFIWKNKGILAGGAALTAFLANPEPYLESTNKLVETVAVNAIKPAVVATGNVAQEAAVFVRWALTIVVIGLVVVVGSLLGSRASRKAAGRAGIVRRGFRIARWFVK